MSSLFAKTTAGKAGSGVNPRIFLLALAALVMVATLWLASAPPVSAVSEECQSSVLCTYETSIPRGCHTCGKDRQEYEVYTITYACSNGEECWRDYEWSYCLSCVSPNASNYSDGASTLDALMTGLEPELFSSRGAGFGLLASPGLVSAPEYYLCGLQSDTQLLVSIPYSHFSVV